MNAAIPGGYSNAHPKGCDMSASSSFKVRRHGVTKTEVLFVLIIIGVLIALIVPAVQKVREAAARTQSINNLKLIGSGMQAFHDIERRFPFNGSNKQSPGSNIKYSTEAVIWSPSSGSWGHQLIPTGMIAIMDKAPKLREIGFFYHLCPGRGRITFEENLGTWSDYFINNYLNDPENAEKPDNVDARRKLDDITDGASNTIFAGHGNISTADDSKTSGVVGSSNIFLGGTFGTARGGPNWRDGATPKVALQRDSADPPDFAKGGWGGPFPAGALFVFCDATVRQVQYNTSAHIFGAFLTPTGNEKVELPD